MQDTVLRYSDIPDIDVANEAWDYLGNPMYPFIEDSYRLARTLTSARLWYNGALTCTPEQYNAIALMSSGLCDGIGVQMHLGFDPDLTKYIPFLTMLGSSGFAWRVS